MLYSTWSDGENFFVMKLNEYFHNFSFYDSNKSCECYEIRDIHIHTGK